LRAGLVEDAREDLRLALAGGLLSARAAARDPDLAPYLSLLPELPAVPFTLTATVPTGLAWLDSEVEVRLNVDGAIPGSLTITAPGADGPARVVRVVEDDVEGASAGDRKRTFVWTLRVLGTGTVQIPALVVEQAGLSASALGGAFPCAGPPGAAELRQPLTFAVPSVVWADHGVPAVWRDRDVWVAVQPEARLETEPAGVASVMRMAVRRDGHAVADLFALPDAALTAVSVRLGPTLLLRQPIDR
jgi:hypothetical protein